MCRFHLWMTGKSRKLQWVGFHLCYWSCRRNGQACLGFFRMDTHCLLIHPIDVGHQNHAIWMTLMIAAIVEEACCCCCFVVVWLPSSSFSFGISERHTNGYLHQTWQNWAMPCLQSISIVGFKHPCNGKLQCWLFYSTLNSQCQQTLYVEAFKQVPSFSMLVIP